MFKLFLSKKGFSLTEIMTVVVILGILAAVSVPIFHNSVKSQNINECKNNIVIIETAIKQGMTGMFDNGKPQNNADGVFYINFDHADPNHVSTTVVNNETVRCFKLEENESKAFTLADLRCGYYTIEQAVDDVKNINENRKVINANYITDPKNWEWEKYVLNLGIITEDEDGNPLPFEEIALQIEPDKYEMGCKKTKKNQLSSESDGYFLKKSDMGETKFYTFFDNQETPECPFSTKASPCYYYILEDGTVFCDCGEY